MNRSKKIRAIAALGTLSGAVWAGTFATFTDGGDAVSTFSTGTVALELNNDPADPSYDFATLSTSGMKPGDVVFAELTVENAGTINSTWTMASTESESVLSGELQLGAVVGAVNCGAIEYAVAAAVPGNVVIASGDLSAAAVTTPRALAGAASETLCVRVELPVATGNVAQGLTTTSTFAFSLTQA